MHLINPSSTGFGWSTAKYLSNRSRELRHPSARGGQWGADTAESQPGVWSQQNGISGYVKIEARGEIPGTLSRGRSFGAKEDLQMAKRELIEPTKGDKRFVRRDDEGRFKESDDAGRSLSQDRRRKAKAVVKAGHGDKGDRRDKG